MRAALGAVFGVAVRAVVAAAFFAAVITGFLGFLAAALGAAAGFALVTGLDAIGATRPLFAGVPAGAGVEMPP
jgi:hypothetical protein